MTYEQITEERRDDVVVLTLHRPERLNAWTPRMTAELVDAKSREALAGLGALSEGRTLLFASLLLADQLIALDRLNPQTAAKLLPPLGRWRRFAPDRAGPMRAELERIVAIPGLSKDLFEQASKSLEG